MGQFYLELHFYICKINVVGQKLHFSQNKLDIMEYKMSECVAPTKGIILRWGYPTEMS